MLNNKGQSLILFVIVLPVLLLILVLVIDVGKVLVLKQELNNINEIVLDYGLDNLDNLDNEDLPNELTNLVKLNNSNIDEIEIYLENNKIYASLSEKTSVIFSGLVDISIFNVKSSYVGYIDNDEKKIEKVSG